ncbi:LysR family transcriptional regulator [Pigmentiphaga sp. NML080357]|uniref:LysR family transcriptional regulator n=1 Tax=Pigmentiphaga sp. NML080357 TaxID=2008675 RepID=UPI0013032E45|nr:LysR family transcriptional regulator [Pigmentiphaga sp. NML080357]
MNPRFDLLTLQLLRRVDETGSVARAAESVHLTASAASKRILELESQLGIALLVRRPEGARLTAAGRAVAQRTERVLDELRALQGDLAGFSAGTSGTVRIASNTSGMCAGLADQLARFAADFPAIRISVTEATSAAVVEAVANGSADLGIAHASAQAGALRSMPYARTPLVLAVPSGHELAERTSVSHEETLRFPHIARAAGSALAQFSGPVEPDPTRMPPVATQVTSFPAVFSLVSAGLGVAVVPAAPAEWHVPANVRLVPLSDDWASFELRLVIDPGVVPSPATARLLQVLQAGS